MPTDPIAAFDAAVAALAREDWPSLAALCDDASLAQFRREMLHMLDPEPGARFELTADMLLRDAPDMPREVAEYQVARHREHADPARRLAEELPDVPDLATLRAMPARDVFAAWLAGRSVRRQIARMVAEGRLAPDVAERAGAEPLGVVRYVAIGVVRGGERMAHVLYRHADEGDVTPRDGTPGWGAELSEDERALAADVAAHGYPQLTTLRRQPDGTWRLLADHGLFHLGGLVVRRVEDADGTSSDDRDDGGEA